MIGEGCEQQSPINEECLLVTSNRTGYTLKRCFEEDFDQCNFYAYKLGKREGDAQYIIQRYEEKGDILVDVLEYSISANSIQPVKTVLFQTVNDGSNEAKAGNNDFSATISRYQ